MDDFIDCTLPELLLLQSALRLQRMVDRREPLAHALQQRLDLEITWRRGLRTMRQTPPSEAEETAE